MLLITLERGGHVAAAGGREATTAYADARAGCFRCVSGAGDTSIAVFALALAARRDQHRGENRRFTNHDPAGVVVAKLGTASLNVTELREMFVKTEGWNESRKTEF